MDDEGELMDDDGKHFSSKRKALRKTSNLVAAWLSVSAEADLFGYDLDLTDAERERMEWAWSEVQNRLFRMGGEDR